jgi:hypothetical protein
MGGVKTATSGGNFFENVGVGAITGGSMAAAGYAAFQGLSYAKAKVTEWWNSMPGTAANYSLNAQAATVGASRSFPLLNEAAVKAGLNDALDMQANLDKEVGGYIVKNRLTGDVSTDITDVGTRGSVGIRPLGFLKSLLYEVLGQFHTHPLVPPSALGPSYGIGGDVGTFLACPAAQCGSVHIVVDPNNVYGFERTNPTVSRIGSAHDILGR